MLKYLSFEFVTVLPQLTIMSIHTKASNGHEIYFIVLSFFSVTGPAQRLKKAPFDRPSAVIVSTPFHLKMETNSIPETLCYFKILDILRRAETEKY
jgi:hypothetical protein